MATVIEIQETKMEGLCEHAEKVVRHAKKLMECLEMIKEYGGEGHYAERYGRHKGKPDYDEYDKEYYRY